MQNAGEIDLLVFPYYEGEKPPKHKVSSWVHAAKKLGKDGIFVVISGSGEFENTKRFVDEKLKPVLKERCILVPYHNLFNLPKCLSESGFSASEKTRFYDFGMHTRHCPAGNANFLISHYFRLAGVKSHHIPSLSVMLKSDELRRKKRIKIRLVERSAKRFFKNIFSRRK